MTVRILVGDCRDRLKELESGSVHCCVSSPPYFGLRDYGTAQWEGGSADCDHVQMTTGMSDKNTLGPNGYLPETNAANVGRKQQYRHACGKCGATRIDRQMGLEPTPDEFVAGMVAVFREVRRVLRDDGTLWLNIGDSYAGGGRGGGGSFEAERANWRDIPQRKGQRPGVNGCKPKDLIGIPWLLAFALRADGWYLRQDIIWSKPNPMPESVRDRCTKAHEYLFLLSKSPRYYFDADAISEQAVYGGEELGILRGDKSRAEAMGRNPSGNELLAVRRRESKKRGEFNGKTNALPGREAFRAIKETRNKRSVWEVTTRPFSEAHFATFPPALIEPCILAGCLVGGTVLDPFGGAGTTGLVADRLQRNAILIELNPEYAAIAERRIHGDAGMFADLSCDSGSDRNGENSRSEVECEASQSGPKGIAQRLVA